MHRPIRMATVYRRHAFDPSLACDMSLTRWFRISEAFAERGYGVDVIVSANTGLQSTPKFRCVSLDDVDWNQYDVVKTLFHEGFNTLSERGGDQHPFIISKLGSVVGRSNQTEGVHFFDTEREELFETQTKINARSRYITILTEQSRELWANEHGRTENVLYVPTGVDRTIPPPGESPYGSTKEKIAVYIGNLYVTTQPEINLLWQTRLNSLGRLLKHKGIRLYLVGPAKTDRLEADAVTYLGPVDNSRIWDYQYFADVGIVLAQGAVQHNESSKIYYYLRTGLPVVSEAPIPNNHIIREANLGLIADYADDRAMAEMIEAAIFRKWDRDAAVKYMLQNHTWDKRVEVYDRLIKSELRMD